MTERWRKKLGDLDGTGPTDNVLARAHQGPTQPDPQIDLPSTSTKVITGVAAFLVFALAISVFAIPALRMRDGGPAGPGEQLLPLWPARSLDDLEALQSRAAAGDPDATWALQAGPVVQRFGGEVLGWGSSTFEMSIPDHLIQQPTGMATGDPSGGPSGTASSSIEAVLTYRGTNDSGSCDGAFCPQRIHVVLYKPLGTGEDSIWAVREVHTETTSMEAGARYSDGDSIFVGTRLFKGEVPTLAYHVGPGSCDVDYATSEWTEVEGSGQMGIEMGTGAGIALPVQHGCAEATPGYVWLATADASLIANDEIAHVADPFAGGGARLLSLTAVPVTFAPATPSGTFIEPPTMAPTHFSDTGTPVAVGGQRYESEFGWTIDRPAGAETSPVDDGVSFQLGGGVAVVIIRLSGAQPGDDSTFPLDPSVIEPSQDFPIDLGFRGDGQAFRLFVTNERLVHGPGDLTNGERATIERMVTSISFDEWVSGETRNGWTALAPVLPNATMEWIGFDGERFIVTNDADGNRAVLGPIPRCDADGEPVLGVSEATIATITCPDGTAGSWNAAGVALKTNDAPFLVGLDVAPGVRSWDGWLLVDVSGG